MARMIRRPVCPVMSLITNGGWRFICTIAFLHPLDGHRLELDRRMPMARL
jgi:hypothetical protein